VKFRRVTVKMKAVVPLSAAGSATSVTNTHQGVAVGSRPSAA
jgi:hypothetical protein